MNGTLAPRAPPISSLLPSSSGDQRAPRSICSVSAAGVCGFAEENALCLHTGRIAKNAVWLFLFCFVFIRRSKFVYAESGDGIKGSARKWWPPVCGWLASGRVPLFGNAPGIFMATGELTEALVCVVLCVVEHRVEHEGVYLVGEATSFFGSIDACDRYLLQVRQGLYLGVFRGIRVPMYRFLFIVSDISRRYGSRHIEKMCLLVAFASFCRRRFVIYFCATEDV